MATILADRQSVQQLSTGGADYVTRDGNRSTLSAELHAYGEHRLANLMTEGAASEYSGWKRLAELAISGY